jgi:deoxycytidine triphosphate deaminase
MIITDREIQIALQQGSVNIDPRPKADAYSSASVDLTLGDTFSVWVEKQGSRFDLVCRDLSIQIF